MAIKVRRGTNADRLTITLEQGEIAYTTDTKKFYVGDGTTVGGIEIGPSSGAGSGTVTSVAALTLATSGTDLTSTVANSTTTPVITLNVPSASATNRGVLTSADWSLFNGKQAGSTNLTSLSSLTFASTAFVKMTAAGTFALDTTVYTANTGTVTTVSVTTANGVSGTVANAGTTPAITLSLGAITPTSVNSVTLSGTSTPTLAVTGTSSISGSNTGDNAVNSLYSGLVSNATHTGDATGATALTVVGLRGVALPALTASAGFLRYTGTGTNTWVFDTATYLTGNQSISFTPGAGGDVTGSSSGATSLTPTLSIGANKVTNSMLAQVATASFLGRVTAATGNVETLTATQATSLLNVFSSTLKGLAPASGGGTTNFLRADGTWAAPSGGGGGTLTVGTSAITSGTANRILFEGAGNVLQESANLTWDGSTLKATSVEATAGGVYATSTFTGTFTDGIVIDHTAGIARISAGASDSISFYNGGVGGSLLGTASSNGDWSFVRFVDIGNGTLIGGATNPLLAAAGSSNTYVQAYIHNDLAGTSASSDFSAYPDNGTDASGWIDMGITSSVYSDPAYPITGANEGYIFMSAPSGAGKTGNVVYATDSTGSSNAHQWYVGGFGQAKANWKMQLNASGLQLANALPIGSGGTGQTTAVAAFDALSPLTTKGDIVVHNGTDNVRLAVGSNTQVLVADSATATGLRWAAAGGFSGGTLTSQLILAAGTATAATAPLEFQTGTLNTTAELGAMEFDGIAPYFSIAASTRGVLPTEQWVVLTGTNTLTSQTAVQPIFDGGGGPTNGSVTLPVGTYQYECSFAATGLSATSGSFGFALGGAATKTFTYQAQASKTGTSLTTPMATVSTFGTAPITTLVSNSTGTVANLLVKGIIRVTVAGTVIPQISLTVASAAIIQAGSYFRVSPIGNATVATVGNWI